MKRLSLLALVLGVFLAAGHAQDAALIAHPSVGDAKLSADDVKGILLGTKTKWDSGGVIKVVVLSDGALHDRVIKDFTQRTSDQFDKYWKKQVFTGKGIMPQVAKTDAEVLEYVAKTPGAFGYVGKENATGAVKVLTP